MNTPRPKVTFATLNYLWWGVSIGGRHYTGKVSGDQKEQELMRSLSRKEAKTLAEENESRIWDTETNRFETLEDLERAALQWCETNLSAPWLLLHNDALNPNHVVGGKGFSKKRIAQLNRYQKWWWSQSDAARERIWRRGYARWNKLLELP